MLSQQVDNIKISIIIPVYNASLTIKKLLDSIQKQTFRDFEAIIIDDGSTDNTLNICKRYAEYDSRFKVLHKINEGVAMARQYGIERASGQYSIHADGDDWIESKMLESLYNIAKQENSDIVISDFYINKGSQQHLSIQKPSSLDPKRVLQDIFENKLFGALWNKLIKTELYRKYNAKFFHGINHCEDLLILVQLLQHDEIKVSYYDKAFYHYVMNTESITNNFTYETYKTRLKFRDKLKELLIINNSNNIIEKVSFGIFTEAFIYDVLSIKEIIEGLSFYKEQINHIKSLKWRLGFFFIKCKQYKLAHKFIHY